MPVPARCRGRHNDALGVNHLAHDAARAVRDRHENGLKTELLGADLLQASEAHIRCVGERRADSAEQRPGEGIGEARMGESEAARCVGAGVTREVRLCMARWFCSIEVDF